MRANYHTHCDFCDGKASAKDMAAAASAAGYQVLGFSSHAPLPFPTDWNLPAERLAAYVAEIRRLAADWAPGGQAAEGAGRPLEILLGLEADWIEGVTGPATWAGQGFDYLLGSVHYVRTGTDKAWTVDAPIEEFDANLASEAGGEARLVWKAYWRAVAELVAAGGFEILGHLDLVKKNNGGGRCFDEAEPAYLAAAREAIELLRGRDIVVEVNLGGIARGKTKEPYPSLPLLRMAREAGARICFSADAHAPGHLGVALEAGRELAEAAGYRSVAVLSGGSWREVALNLC
jgi:histidinol-phosphatase (PHP family)